MSYHLFSEPWFCGHSDVFSVWFWSCLFSVYSWLVQIQPWLLSKMQKIQQYYFVCTNITYFQTIWFFLLAVYHSEMKLHSATVRLSVYSWLVQVQTWLLSKMQKIQQYYFVCTNSTYLQTICFLLMAQHDSMIWQLYLLLRLVCCIDSFCLFWWWWNAFDILRS
jgi:hypothetical protein